MCAFTHQKAHTLIPIFQVHSPNIHFRSEPINIYKPSCGHNVDTHTLVPPVIYLLRSSKHTPTLQQLYTNRRLLFLPSRIAPPPHTQCSTAPPPTQHHHTTVSTKTCTHPLTRTHTLPNQTPQCTLIASLPPPCGSQARNSATPDTPSHQKLLQQRSPLRTPLASRNSKPWSPPTHHNTPYTSIRKICTYTTRDCGISRHGI